MQGKRWIISVLLVLGAATLVWASETMSVQVKEGRLYASPNFLSKLQATLPYGAKLQVEGEDGAWRQVSSPKGKGWMHISALTEKEVSLRAGSGAVSSGASSEEMTLAGKGFNKQVEASYKSQNKGLNYGAVDKMEKAYPVTVAQVQKFIQTGGLHAPKNVVPPAAKGGGQNQGASGAEGGVE
jgi:hypothetical protein